MTKREEYREVIGEERTDLPFAADAHRFYQQRLIISGGIPEYQVQHTTFLMRRSAIAVIDVMA